MKNYESVIIINPSLEENKIKETVKKITDLISNDGKLISVEEIGKKKLAYEIRKQHEGYYVIYDFKANADFVRELERIYRITDEIIKFIVVRKDD